MTTPDKAYHVSWDQFHRDAKALAWRLMDNQQWEVIIAITRGGLVPAAIISRELEVRVIETISIASYDHQDQSEAKILKPMGETIDALVNAGKSDKILIIDDLVDTGKTGKVLRKLLPDAHFATVYAKPAGRDIVDTFVTEVSQDTWIFFPWDLSLQFTQPIKKGRE